MKLAPVLFVAIAAGFVTNTAQAESYKFKLNNKSHQKMVQLLVSEDGQQWGPFDLGAGIPAGSTATLVWAESTNDEGCEQKVKAVYEDKSESGVETFDFCESDLELDFE